MRALIATRVERMACWCAPATRGWRWFPSAVLVGVVPLSIALLPRSSGHQFVSALLLAALCLALVWRDAWWKGMATIGTVFAAHSALAILLAYHQPVAAEALFPGGAEYWRKQHEWITTGVDAEYELQNWIPAHAFLLLGTTLFSISSAGVITFHHGFYEVDLMNYYNGQLLHHSQNAFYALSWGWHIWSLLRGLAYTVLSYELIAFALRIFARRAVVAWSQHARRLALGLCLLLADGIAKYYLMELVRIQLLRNLSAP